MSTTFRPPELIPFAEARDEAESAVVPMRDGVRLHADVYLRATAHRGRRVPAVLIRAPYGVREEFMMLPDIARYLSERGLAVVVQDVRGKFRSEGERVPFLHEVQDGYDTLEWVVSQSWSDGRVGMYGESYYGFTQWAAAASGHPALKALVPVVTGSCLPTWHMRPGVVPFLAAPVGWFAGCWNDASIFAGEDSQVLDFGRTPVLAIAGDGFERAHDLISDLMVAPSAEVLSRTYPNGPPAPHITIPVLHRGGWWDNVKGSQLDDWRAVQQAPGRTRQYLEMAAMDHYSERFVLSEHAGDVRADAESDDAIEWIVGAAAEFLEQHLGLREPVQRPRVRAEIANAGWVELDSWPAPSARDLIWHLDDAGRANTAAEGGTLRRVAASRDTSTSWTHDPGDLVPSLTNGDFHVLPGLPDEGQVHARRDVATFTTDPLNDDLDILGEVAAVLEVRSSCPALPLIVGLHHVREGRATVITEGSRSSFVGGGWTRVHVVLGSTAYRVARGDRLRVSVSTSRFPRYLPPLGHGGKRLARDGAQAVRHRAACGIGQSTRGTGACRRWRRE